jgi:hypothetical protein
MVRNGILSIFISRGLIRDKNDEVPIIFSPTEWFRTKAFFIFSGMARTEFQAFSVPLNRRNLIGMNQNFHLFRVPWNNFFLGKLQP